MFHAFLQSTPTQAYSVLLSQKKIFIILFNKFIFKSSLCHTSCNVKWGTKPENVNNPLVSGILDFKHSPCSICCMLSFLLSNSLASEFRHQGITQKKAYNQYLVLQKVKTVPQANQFGKHRVTYLNRSDITWYINIQSELLLMST